MNNLQGWAMNEYLRYMGFKWLENIDNFDIMSMIKVQYDIFRS